MALGSGGFGARAPGSRDGRRLCGQAETLEEGHDAFALGDVGDDAPSAAARARQNLVEVDASDQAGPIDARPDRLGDAGTETRARPPRSGGLVGAAALGWRLAVADDKGRDRRLRRALLCSPL